MLDNGGRGVGTGRLLEIDAFAGLDALEGIARLHGQAALDRLLALENEIEVRTKEDGDVNQGD